MIRSDEDHAFEILHKNRKIHAALIKQHDGILIKEMEDEMILCSGWHQRLCDVPLKFRNLVRTIISPLKICIHEREIDS